MFKRMGVALVVAGLLLAAFVSPAGAVGVGGPTAVVSVADTVHGQAVRVRLTTDPGHRATFTVLAQPLRSGAPFMPSPTDFWRARMVALNGTDTLLFFPRVWPVLEQVTVWVGSRVVAERVEWVN